jgi:hypothetical protein
MARSLIKHVNGPLRVFCKNGKSTSQALAGKAKRFRSGQSRLSIAFGTINDLFEIALGQPDVHHHAIDIRPRGFQADTNDFLESIPESDEQSLLSGPV